MKWLGPVLGLAALLVLGFLAVLFGWPRPPDTTDPAVFAPTARCSTIARCRCCTAAFGVTGSMLP